MKRPHDGTDKNSKEGKIPKKKISYIKDDTYKGPIEDLFEIDNLFNQWDFDRDTSCQITLYYDCKAKKSMKCSGGKIREGDVIDLVLHYKQCYDGQYSHYYAFSKRNKKLRKDIKDIKKMIKDDPDGGDGLVEDAVMELTACQEAMVFNFNDDSDDESSDSK